MTAEDWYEGLRTYIAQHPVGGDAARRQCTIRVIEEAANEGWCLGFRVGAVVGVLVGVALAVVAMMMP